MLKNILIPTDFSECSSRALRLGLAIAEKFDAQAHVLHASAHIDRSTFSDPRVLQMVGDMLDDEAKRLDEAAQEQMKNLVKEIGEVDESRVNYRVVQGSPGTSILEVAEDVKADMIVMGTHGRTGVGDLILGSTAERVTRKANCAVMTIKPEGYPYLKD